MVQILPALNLISLIFSFYSLVLVYVGLPVVMKVLKDRAIIAWIDIFLVAGPIVLAF